MTVTESVEIEICSKIVRNNSSLGYIRHEQKALYNGRFVSTEFRRVDLLKSRKALVVLE